MTLATTWVRRGVAAEFPQKYEVDEAELGRIEKLARLQLADAQEDLEAAQRKDDDEDSEDDEDDAGVSTGVSNGTTKAWSVKPKQDTIAMQERFLQCTAVHCGVVRFSTE